ncbi:hypothetical protein [Streptomyces sp. NPDC014734]|uniref:hypothetical protein n=1 Tax=Streptomyces sp. NPDC014734 TaxID=3364886 RepID=UPI0036FB55E3
MGSLRNPIGPLPSTIYWRRRAVAVALVALLAALIVWAVTSRGGKGTTDDSRSGASSPAHEITPGPTPSGPAITQQPGGRDESGDSDAGGTGGTSTGSGGGAGDSGNGAGGAGGAGTGGAGGSGATAARPVPAGSSLPDCAPGSLQLTLSTELNYALGKKPKFRLTARNTSAATCKADFGPRSAVLTVTEAGGADSQVWSSKDCPRNPEGLLLEFPAGATVVHTVEWDLKKSAAHCATSPTGTAGPGTYLVEANVAGQPVRKGTPPRASFVLAKD